MYTLAVNDHTMVAHAQCGATYAVEAAFRAPRLDGLNMLIDRALAGQSTAPAFLAHQLFQALTRACVDGALGDGGRTVTTIRVTPRERPTVSTAYKGSLV